MPRLIAAFLAAVTGLLVLATLARPAVASTSLRPHPQSVSDRLVLALYYTWFDENTWSYDQLSDLPAPTYVSRDRAVMGRHIDQAKAAGIDAFLVAWYGPGADNPTEGNLTALLEEAAARDFRIGVLFETDSPFFSGTGDVTAALQHLNTVHANQQSYLRADGRPVVFFWRPSVYAIETWRDIRNQVDPGYQNIWISEGVDTSLLQVFDGHYLYSNTWNPPTSLDATNGKFASLVASASQQMGAAKLWIATAMPGYDDTRIRPTGFARDRNGGNYYSESWQSAVNSGPSWVVVNSFNEWPEGTYVEPSVAFGDQYLNLTAQWSGTFKGQPGPTVQSSSMPVAAPEPTPAPDVATPTAFVDVTLLNVRAGPSTDFDILSQVVQNTALAITGYDVEHPDWYQVLVNGDTDNIADAWVYAPLVTAVGPLEQIPAAIAPKRPSTVPNITPSPSYNRALVLPDPSRRLLVPYPSP